MKRILTTLTLAATTVGLLATSATAAPMKPLSIFVIVGQSNASGYGLPLPTRQLTNPRVWDLTQGIKRATEPLGTSGGVGFGLTTGIVLARHGLRVGLVQCASGGLDIDAWQPGQEFYDRCLRWVTAAKTYGTLAGILFNQGESDMKTAEQAATWRTDFLTFTAAFRSDIGAPTLPVIVGLTRDFSTVQDYGLPYGAEVRAAQRSLTALGICVVSGDDLPLDGQHYTPAGYRVLGERYARAYLGLLRASR